MGFSSRLGHIRLDLSADTTTLVRDLDRGRQAARRYAQQSTRVFSSTSVVINQHADIVRQHAANLSRLRQLALTSVGALGFGEMITEAKDAFMGIEKAGKALKFATGDVIAAKEAFAYASEEADRLGVALMPAVQSFGRLSAAARGTVMEGRNTKEMFEAIMEASTVFSLSQDDTKGAFRAIEQMMSKGKVQAEKLRGQLGERLPRAFQIATDAMGVSTMELNKMLEMGEVMSDDFLPKFARELRKSLAGSVEDSTRSAQASFNRFQNGLLKMKAAMGEKLVSGLASAADASASFLSDGENVDSMLDGLSLAAVAAGSVLSGKLAGGLSRASREMIRNTSTQLENIRSVRQASVARHAYAVASQQQAAAAMREARMQQQMARETNLRGAALTNINLRAQAAATAHAQATVRLAIAQRHLAASSAASAVAMRVAARAGAVFRGVMGFLGGPAGIIATVVTAAAGYAMTSRDATTATRDWAREVAQLSGNLKKVELIDLSKKLEEAQARMREIKESLSERVGAFEVFSQGLFGGDSTRREIWLEKGELEKAIDAYKGKIEELRNATKERPTKSGPIVDTKAMQQRAKAIENEIAGIVERTRTPVEILEQQVARLNELKP
uniref:Tape measure domain-containing protein n=1 Tax=Candidatus Kentrum sp. MB TaxID=2138164 RepID=A0A450Y1Z4_9GAMM|nr:MAG: tape measure domain-containing protein [Candidatus Kentron sp. MB]VFK35560.1 MAG: tape measure domain-containing protein [Candidatus Kentron sp. MB]VFK77393.1 MAG: tape measure domain-containing protein [Candidatus Kentron sp. MB]